MNYNETEKKIIVADAMTELNYKQKKLLLASENEAVPQREKYADELIKTVGTGIYNKVRARLYDAGFRDKTFAVLEKRSVVAVTAQSVNYPPQLKGLPVMPLVIYARGNISLLSDRIFGVVGSRKTTAAVIEECKRTCEALTKKLTIATGIADGGDSAAIRGSLPSGRIICVLPCGHDGRGASNYRLLREVEKNGLSVSEFPPTSPAQRHTFILRNRLLAGLSEGVLVVSAAEKSGALSTAGYAVDYSKEVFAFPYCPGMTSGVGCNNLIKNGAYLCDGADDIFSILGIECDVKEKAEELTDEESAIVKLLKAEGEMHAEKIARALGKKLTEILITCSMLEIKGLVVKTGGNEFAAI